MKPRLFGPLGFYREALRIALPVMLQQLIMSLVSLIDNFMVAGLGDLSMAAVNVSNQLNFVYLVLVGTVSGAGGIYLAQFKGAGNTEGMRHAYRFKIILVLAVSTAYFILCRLIPGEMISIMTMGNAAQNEIVGLGSEYIRLIAFTLLPLGLSSAIGTSFREIGSPKIPLLISAAATLVNTAGNWLLIYGNLGAPALGVRGAAIATIIARLFELAVFLSYAHVKKAPFYVSLFGITKIDKRLIGRILSKTAMMFVSEMSWVGSETVITALYNGRGGTEVVAGMAAGWNIANIFFLLYGGIFATATVLIGGTLGAGKLDEARHRAQWLKSGSVIGGFIIAAAGSLASIFIVPLVFSNLTPDARRITLGIIFVILAYLPLWALLNAQFAISRAGGDTAMGMYTDLLVNTFLYIPAAVILAWHTKLGPVVLFAIVKLTDIAKYYVGRYFLKKERWVRNLAVKHEGDY